MGPLQGKIAQVNAGIDRNVNPLGDLLPTISIRDQVFERIHPFLFIETNAEFATDNLALSRGVMLVPEMRNGVLRASVSESLAVSDDGEIAFLFHPIIHQVSSF